MKRPTSLSTAAACILALLIPMRAPAQEEVDLCVYEATPGGIAMAVRAAREGLSVVLVNHTDHPGGACSNGLGVWDTLYEGYRAPLYQELRRAIMQHYQDTHGPDSQEYRDSLPGSSGHTNGRFSAGVFEKLVTRMIEAEPNIEFAGGFYPVKAVTDGREIRAVEFQAMNGPERRTVHARIFADASYEGDLIPVAGASFRLGRESRDEFNETHAGRLFMKRGGGAEEPAEGPAARKTLNLRYFGPSGPILEEASTGEGDSNVQAFNFRTVLSADPENQLLPEKPADYDPAFYETLEYGSVVPGLPGNRIVWNRPQLIGLQTDYVRGDWAQRQEIMDRHWEATLGLLWHLQNAESVPEEKRAYWRRYGLARDEFADHGHRPREIYVREGRRLDGRYLITEHDLVLAEGLPRAPVHSDAVAFTDWYMDSHACTEELQPGSMHEGKHTLHSETRPGHIPWRSFLAKELDNLIVPVCLASTHVAWGAIRLEPTWMHTGEVAGFASALALESGVAPANLDAAALQRSLAENAVPLDFLNDVDVSGEASWAPAAHFLSVRGFFPSYDARPTAALSARVATEWLKEAARLQSETGDPMGLARRLFEIENNPATVEKAILGMDFLKLADEETAPRLRSLMDKENLHDSSPLTRGDGLLLIYRLLER